MTVEGDRRVQIPSLITDEATSSEERRVVAYDIYATESGDDAAKIIKVTLNVTKYGLTAP